MFVHFVFFLNDYLSAQTSLLSRADFFTCCIPDKLGGSGPPAEPVEILPGPSVQLLNSIRRHTDSILAIRSLEIRNTVCCACGCLQLPPSLWSGNRGFTVKCGVLEELV